MKNVFGKDFNVVNQIDVGGKSMLIVELSTPHYIDGLMTKFVIVNPSQFYKFDQVPDKAEVVND